MSDKLLELSKRLKLLESLLGKLLENKAELKKQLADTGREKDTLQRLIDQEKADNIRLKQLMEDARRKYKDAEESIENIQDDLDSVQEHNDRLQSQLDEKAVKLTDLEEKCQALSQESDGKTNVIVELNKEIEGYWEKIKDQNESLDAFNVLKREWIKEREDFVAEVEKLKSLSGQQILFPEQDSIETTSDNEKESLQNELAETKALLKAAKEELEEKNIEIEILKDDKESLTKELESLNGPQKTENFD